MRRASIHRLFALGVLVATLTPGLPVAHAAPSAPVSPQTDVVNAPDTLVGGGVNDFTMAASRVTWLTYPTCPSTPPANVVQAVPQAAGDPVTMQRIPTYGGASRLVFSRNDARAPGVCNPYRLRSNIVADENNVYWLDSTGLVSLPHNANPGDAPALVNGDFSGTYNSVLAIGSTQIFVLTANSSPFAIAGVSVNVVDKATGASTPFFDIGNAVEQATFDDQYLYYLVSGDLRRWKPGDTSATTIAANVKTYYAEGARLRCTPTDCFSTNRVFIARGDNKLFVYDNRTNRLGSNPFYTSPEGNSTIFLVTGDGANVFTFEQRNYCDPPGGMCFPNRFSRTLYRIPFSTAVGAAIYNITVPNGITPPVINRLATDGTFLFWDQTFALQKLANNAAALPRVDMRVTGIEITQGIQSQNNTVRLIQNRRTFVRVYVQANSAAVPGVTMHLYGSWSNGEAGPLLPVNSVGTAITVLPTPSRNNINDSFLFELPWEWTTKSQVRLRAVLNPYQFPLQNSYANNELSSSTLDFRPSPRLEVQFVGFGYTLNNQTYYPRLRDDVVQTYSYIRRTYPLASTPGFFGDTSPGFRPNLWYVDDDSLGARVNRSDQSCSDNLCASAYTNSRLKAMRAEEQLPASVFMYGMVSDAAGWFPRGQEGGGGNVSSGPTGVPGGVLANEPPNSDGTPSRSVGGWDTDTSYGDWYAAHEIGHSLGRPHPTSGSDNPATTVVENCGHSRSGDLSYEHGNTTSSRAPIGPGDNSIAGFDGGDPEFGLPRAVLPSATWNDFMSYCSTQWISNYTYNSIYDKLIAPPALAARGRVSVQGDWLSVFGSIAADTNRATIDHLRRRASVMQIPPRTPGGYSIRLLDANGRQLADYPFTPDPATPGASPGFGQVVPFVAGTRSVQIVRGSDKAVLASEAISANAPTISGVALVNAPNPVDGIVTLGWTASDADGNALTFDIFYSRDGGTTFQPVKLGAIGTNTQIDTARLGGSGTAILRVVASDGGQSAQADSAAFTMADKAPQPRIISPENGARLHWGQLVNLSGEAEDFQDGSVSGANLVWSTQRGLLGTGALLTVEQLPAGANIITLTATNRAGIAASTSITVFVDDDLRLPGPTLSVGPSQTGWSVGANETALQTAQLSIGNAGGGTLNWTATSDAAWLTLGATSGTAPATLTLSADPKQISGSSARANVTIIKPASGDQPAQTMTIPVSLTKGNAFTGPAIIGSSPNRRMSYLPLVQR